MSQVGDVRVVRGIPETACRCRSYTWRLSSMVAGGPWRAFETCLGTWHGCTLPAAAG